MILTYGMYGVVRSGTMQKLVDICLCCEESCCTEANSTNRSCPWQAVVTQRFRGCRLCQRRHDGARHGGRRARAAAARPQAVLQQLRHRCIPRAPRRVACRLRRRPQPSHRHSRRRSLRHLRGVRHRDRPSSSSGLSRSRQRSRSRRRVRSSNQPSNRYLLTLAPAIQCRWPACSCMKSCMPWWLHT